MPETLHKFLNRYRSLPFSCFEIQSPCSETRKTCVMARGQRSDVTLGDCEEFKIGSSLLMSEALSTVGSSEFVTAAKTSCSPAEIGSTSDSAPFTSESCSSRIQRMLKCRSEFDTELEFEIASSKDHWSELVDPDGALRAGQELVLRSNTTDELASETNRDVFDSF